MATDFLAGHGSEVIVGLFVVEGVDSISCV